MRLCILLAVVCSAAAGAREFVVDYGSNSFSKDGKPFQIISGSIHYFNVPEELWEDRLLSMKNCGVNTLQTYAEWRGIEPQNGVFDFSGRNNITRFIEIAHKLGLLVNLRPGPFIDSEREFGGLPWWLMQVNPNMKLRTNDPEYMKFLTRYWEKLLTQVRPLLYSNGGPIILVQIENEYGSYPACDFTYTGALRDMAISLLGKDVVLYSTDGNNDPFLKCGKNEGVYTTVDFGTQHDVKTSFETQRRHQLRGPSVNSEFYVGWFDHWGRVHQKISNDAVVRSLDQMLSMNASANIYMFHGGTHFGFDNAAKLDPNYKPVLTSYDFDSPLNEAGDPTDKYFAIKNVIRKYAPVPADNPVPKPKAALGDVVLGMKSDLKTVLNVLKSRGKASMSTNPLSFESLSHGYGLVAYETTVSFRPFSPALLKVPGLRDRGYVYVDHELKGILSREIDSYEMPLQIRENQTLTIVVENQGRVGFGAGIMDPKGILEPVQLGNHTLTNWWNTPLPQSDDRNGSFSWSLFDQDVQPEKREQNNTTGLIGLRAYGGTFQIANQTHGVLDTFLNTAGWGKGFVFINGVNIGRYWPSQGPQITLYVPAPYLRLGQNNITVVEQEAAPASLKLSFVDKPLIDEAVPQ